MTSLSMQSNKPSKGVLRHVYERGDIGVSCLFALFAAHAVERITHLILGNYNML